MLHQRFRGKHISVGSSLLACADFVNQLITIRKQLNLLGTINRTALAVRDEISCIVALVRKYQEKNKKKAQLSRMKPLVLFLIKQKNLAKQEQQYKKIKGRRITMEYQNECSIRDFEARTFQPDLVYYLAQTL